MTVKIGYDPAKKYRCPKCWQSGTVDAMFGVRQVGNAMHKQPWCNSCRSVHIRIPRLPQFTLADDARLIRSTYRYWFPNDTCKSRSKRFMVAKLQHRLKDKLVLADSLAEFMMSEPSKRNRPLYFTPADSGLTAVYDSSPGWSVL